MKLDLNIYRVNKKYLQEKLIARPHIDPLEICATVSAYSYCPLLVLLHYLIELGYDSEEVRLKIKELREFYDITEITGFIYEN